MRKTAFLIVQKNHCSQGASLDTAKSLALMGTPTQFNYIYLLSQWPREVAAFSRRKVRTGKAQ